MLECESLVANKNFFLYFLLSFCCTDKTLCASTTQRCFAFFCQNVGHFNLSNSWTFPELWSHFVFSTNREHLESRRLSSACVTISREWTYQNEITVKPLFATSKSQHMMATRVMDFLLINMKTKFSLFASFVALFI